MFHTPSRTPRAQLICEELSEKVWAAAMLLTQGLGCVHIDIIGDFLKDCQRRAWAVKCQKDDPNTRYTLTNRKWDDETIVEALHAALKVNLIKHMRSDGQNYIISVPAHEHKLWTVASDLTPCDPAWSYSHKLIPYTPTEDP